MTLRKSIVAGATTLSVTMFAIPVFAKQIDGHQFAILDSNERATNVYSAVTPRAKPLPVAPMVYVIEQSLPDFLRQAARRNGYQITLSPRVRGTLKKKSLPMDFEKILQEIAPQFDLKWHFQQSQVYVSVASEHTTRLIYLGDMGIDDLEDALLGAGLESDAYDLSYVKDSNSVIVNGPVSYIASVELIAESFNKTKKARKDRIKVIRFGTISKN